MTDENHQSSESLDASQAAVRRAIALAHQHGVIDGKIALATYYVIEAGWRMVLPDAAARQKPSGGD